MELLNDFFAKEGIEYFAVLDYKYAREISSKILERAQISPRSIIIFLLPYYVSDGENLSAYATSLDYHIAIKELTGRLIDHLSLHFPENNFRGFGDHSPINECAAALTAGLGIMGKNGLLINEKYGTYVFIADVLTDVEPELLGAREPRDLAFCVGCGACLKACPTGILRGEGSDCLSAITQRKGELTDEEKQLMIRYNTAWGCDICQRVCPYNRSKSVSPLPFFERDRITRIDHGDILAMTKDEFSSRAFAWRGKNTVLRNAKILEDSKNS